MFNYIIHTIIVINLFMMFMPIISLHREHLLLSKPTIHPHIERTHAHRHIVIIEDNVMAGLHSSSPAEPCRAEKQRNVLDHCTLTCLADLIGIY